MCSSKCEMIWLLVAGVLIWLAFRKRKPAAQDLLSQQRSARIENDALAKHRYDDKSAESKREYYANSIDFDFRTMTSTEETLSRYGGPAEYRDYLVRRVDATK